MVHQISVKVPGEDEHEIVLICTEFFELVTINHSYPIVLRDAQCCLTLVV